MKLSKGISGLEFELRENQDGPLHIQFAKGNTLVVDESRNELRLLDGKQNLQLTIRINDAGLELDVNAQKLNIHAEKELNISADKINIAAANQLNLHSAGNMVQRVEKDFLTETTGTHKNVAKVQKLTASLGNVELKANDNIKLDGERVLLNCE
jgi:lipopolysaccharide assembly outer membrane protein LptD (OstA)